MACTTLSFILLGLLSTLVPRTAAQTWTSCDPLNRTDCPVMTALGTNATFNFTGNIADDSIWNNTAGQLNYAADGAEFTIASAGFSPTLISEFYIFFGRISVVMKAATGQGIVSSFVLQSNDLDEFDWEFIGGNSTAVMSNYFGKGNTTTYDRSMWHPVDDTHNFHNYTYLWTSAQTQWWVDDQLVRTLNYADAVGGKNYPQTPCNIRLGIWPAGDPKENNYTIQWAGGEVDYNGGPYTMTVQSVYAEDFTSGSQYSYGDTSGSWQSIKVVAGQSAIAKAIWAPLGVTGHWNTLSRTAQIAVICVVVGVSAVLFALMVFCCIKQRRAGVAERAVADAEFEKGAAELMAYRTNMMKGGFSVHTSSLGY